MRAAELHAEVFQELADVDVLDVVALEQVLVQHRQREHAPARRVERLPRLVGAHAPGLQREQARHHLEIVLHAVMDLGDQRVAVRDDALEPPLALRAMARAILPNWAARSWISEGARPGLGRIVKSPAR